MIWKEIKTEKGVLKYRMPNVIEGYEFLSLIKPSATSSDIFKMKKEFIQALPCLLDYSGCASSFDDMINDKENFFEPLSLIADEVLTDVTVPLKKKNLSPTQSTIAAQA